MRSRILTFSFIVTALVAGLFSATLKPAHAGGGQGGPVDVQIFSSTRVQTPQGPALQFTLYVHAQNYKAIQGTGEVFFKAIGSNDYLRNNGNYVSGYTVFTPTSTDWIGSVKVTVPFSAFPAGSMGKSFAVEPVVLFSTGNFPNVVNSFYSGDVKTVMLLIPLQPVTPNPSIKLSAGIQTVDID